MAGNKPATSPVPDDDDDTSNVLSYFSSFNRQSFETESHGKAEPEQEAIVASLLNEGADAQRVNLASSGTPLPGGEQPQGKSPNRRDLEKAPHPPMLSKLTPIHVPLPNSPPSSTPTNRNPNQRHTPTPTSGGGRLLAATSVFSAPPPSPTFPVYISAPCVLSLTQGQIDALAEQGVPVAFVHQGGNATYLQPSNVLQQQPQYQQPQLQQHQQQRLPMMHLQSTSPQTSMYMMSSSGHLTPLSQQHSSSGLTVVHAPSPAVVHHSQQHLHPGAQQLVVQYSPNSGML